MPELTWGLLFAPVSREQLRARGFRLVAADAEELVMRDLEEGRAEVCGRCCVVRYLREEHDCG